MHEKAQGCRGAIWALPPPFEEIQPRPCQSLGRGLGPNVAGIRWCCFSHGISKLCKVSQQVATFPLQILHRRSEFPTISYHIISYRIVSYHIISYHIISYYDLSVQDSSWKDVIPKRTTVVFQLPCFTGYVSLHEVLKGIQSSSTQHDNPTWRVVQ